MSEHHHLPIKRPSERSFGLVFGVIFLGISLYPLIHAGSIRIWALVVALLFILTAWLMPRMLETPNRLWFRLGLLLGSWVAPLVMGLVFVVAVIPTNLVLRLVRRDVLNQNKNAAAGSYWIIRKDPVGSMKNQF